MSKNTRLDIRVYPEVKKKLYEDAYKSGMAPATKARLIIHEYYLGTKKE